MTGSKTKSDRIVVRWMLILRPAVITATLVPALFIMPRDIIDTAPAAIIVTGTYLLTILYWTALRMSGITRPLMAAQIGFDIFITTVMVHYTGGMDSPFAGFYLMSVMCASLFFGRLLTLVFTAQAAVFYNVYLLVVHPLLRNIPPGRAGMADEAFQGFLYTVLIFGVGVLSSLYAERLRGKDTALTNVLRLLREAKLDTLDILQSMTNGLMTVDNDGRIMYINHMAESILDLDPGSSIGRNYQSFFTRRTAELVRLLDEQRNNPAPLSEVEMEVFTRDGAAIPLGLSFMPLYDTKGGRRGAIVNFKDLTEKKNLLEMVRQADRMAAIGELSAAIAHEIRNPLAAISNAVEIMSEDMPPGDSRTARLLRIIERESVRLQRISSEFLEFARIRDPETVPVPVRVAVEEAIQLILNDPRMTDGVEFRNGLPADAVIAFDPDHLRQIVLNVLINSLQAMNGTGGAVIVSAQTVGEEDGYLRLVFEDTGPGFPAEAMGCMFEPFFSTKKEGTGLGLAIVRKIALSNGGRVFARHRAAGGAEVILDAPVTREA